MRESRSLRPGEAAETGKAVAAVVAAATAGVEAGVEAGEVVAVAEAEGGQEEEGGSAVAGWSAEAAPVRAVAAGTRPGGTDPDLGETAVQAVVEVEGTGDMAAAVAWKREEDREAEEGSVALPAPGSADSRSSTWRSEL